MPALRNMTAIYLTRGEQVLMLHRRGSRVVGDSWTGSAGGHFEKDELNAPRACILRELQEETGLNAADIEDLRLRYITLRLKNGEVRQNYYYFARLREQTPPPASNEGTLHWFDWAEVNALEQPVTARHVLQHYIRQGHCDERLYGGVTGEEGTVFTALTEF